MVNNYFKIRKLLYPFFWLFGKKGSIWFIDVKNFHHMIGRRYA